MKELRVKEEFIILRARGLSFDKIAKRLKVSKPTLIGWNAEFSDRVDEAKLLEIDAVLEQYSLSKVAQVKRLVTLLKKVDSELEKRSLTTVKTDKLLEMSLQLKNELLNEIKSVGQTFKFGGLPGMDFDALDVKRVRVTAID